MLRRGSAFSRCACIGMIATRLINEASLLLGERVHFSIIERIIGKLLKKYSVARVNDIAVILAYNSPANENGIHYLYCNLYITVIGAMSTIITSKSIFAGQISF